MGYDDDSPHPSSTGGSSHPTQIHQDSDIRVKYHPNSGRRADTFKPDEYRRPVPNCNATSEPEPWAPFQTREDFEFAEMVLDAGMTKGQVKALIKLFHKCIKKEGSFTISKYKELEGTFKVASNRLAKVR